MLNNRQSGRRRGRTGQRPQGNGGRGQEQGNRIDNRARGNAPQMLEKYKALARDAQMQGDRVITEYYLQFADHYFRVVAEMRARQEETRRQRDDWQGDDGDNDMLDGDDQVSAEAGDGDDELAAERAHDAQRRQPRQQQQRDNGRARDNRGAEGRGAEGRGAEGRGAEGEGGYRNNRPPRREPRDAGGFDDGPRDGGDRADQVRRVFAGTRSDNDAATIDVSVLPPAFGSDGPITPIADLVDVAEAAAAEPAPKRRGRPRKPAGDDAVA